jgi:hypothetical protein
MGHCTNVLALFYNSETSPGLNRCEITPGYTLYTLHEYSSKQEGTEVRSTLRFCDVGW